MPSARTPKLFVVDGSNIATEGRSTPSLAQLDEAVRAFMDEYPDAAITVVVDATFGHRIAKKEVKAFDEAVANNELVTPPAGAIGRGDAFVLSIANKAKAGVLSNDSFQEFHGDYEWLFEEGRLIGGKPVPHVGWVFVARTPVRGPKSRQAVRDARQDSDGDAASTKQRANRRVRKKAAAEPAEPADEPSRSTRSKRSKGSKGVSAADAEQQATIEAAKRATPPKGQVNDLMPFLEFVEHHPVGTSCTGVVESYSSHGAYIRADAVLLYVPLRLMDDPPPRSARAAMSIGEAVTVVIVGYVPDRRSIDAALPHMAGELAAADSETPAQPTKKASSKRSPAKKAPAKKAAAKKAPAKQVAAKKAPAKKAPARKAAPKKAPAKKAAAKKAPAKRAAAKKAPAKQAPAKKAPAKKTPAKKTPAKKTPAKQAPAKRAPAKRAAKRAQARNRTNEKATAREPGTS